MRSSIKLGEERERESERERRKSDGDIYKERKVTAGGRECSLSCPTDAETDTDRYTAAPPGIHMWNS
jgi:hypothetical protein